MGSIKESLSFLDWSQIVAPRQRAIIFSNKDTFSRKLSKGQGLDRRHKIQSSTAVFQSLLRATTIIWFKAGRNTMRQTVLQKSPEYTISNLIPMPMIRMKESEEAEMTLKRPIRVIENACNLVVVSLRT